MKRLKKISHLFKVYFYYQKTLNQLARKPFGKEIVAAYLSSKKQKIVDKKLLSIFEDLEGYRKQLLKNESNISYDVFEKGLKRKVSEICKSAATPKRWSHFYFHLIKNTNSLRALEIGTNLGISGQYFLSALKLNAEEKHQKGVFLTIEGVKGLCDIAQERFKEINSEGLVDVILHNELYDDILPQIVSEDTTYQVIFVDGNHKYKPTLRYYEMLLESIPDKAIFIFDDINWNNEMQSAWKDILNKNYHAYSVDFFKLGLVIIDKTQAENLKKENFKLFLRF